MWWAPPLSDGETCSLWEEFVLSFTWTVRLGYVFFVCCCYWNFLVVLVFFVLVFVVIVLIKQPRHIEFFTLFCCIRLLDAFFFPAFFLTFSRSWRCQWNSRLSWCCWLVDQFHLRGLSGRREKIQPLSRLFFFFFFLSLYYYYYLSIVLFVVILCLNENLNDETTLPIWSKIVRCCFALFFFFCSFVFLHESICWFCFCRLQSVWRRSTLMNTNGSTCCI